MYLHLGKTYSSFDYFHYIFTTIILLFIATTLYSSTSNIYCNSEMINSNVSSRLQNLLQNYTATCIKKYEDQFYEDFFDIGNNNIDEFLTLWENHIKTNSRIGICNRFKALVCDYNAENNITIESTCVCSRPTFWDDDAKECRLFINTTCKHLRTFTTTKVKTKYINLNLQLNCGFGTNCLSPKHERHTKSHHVNHINEYIKICQCNNSVPDTFCSKSNLSVETGEVTEILNNVHTMGENQPDAFFLQLNETCKYDGEGEHVFVKGFESSVGINVAFLKNFFSSTPPKFKICNILKNLVCPHHTFKANRTCICAPGFEFDKHDNSLCVFKRGMPCKTKRFWYQGSWHWRNQTKLDQCGEGDNCRISADGITPACCPNDTNIMKSRHNRISFPRCINRTSSTSTITSIASNYVLIFTLICIFILSSSV